jgi:hypothetical protein
MIAGVNIAGSGAKLMEQRSTADPGNGRGIWPLQSLNFFMADMQAGIGPFLGVFLLAHGWESGLIGSVMTIGGVAGMLMTAPAGALVDGTTRKRSYVIVPGICTVLASMINHDMEQGSLDAFHAGLGAEGLPKAVTARNVRCLFLDINGPGVGGPDFRLGIDQMRWLERELKAADESYPADLEGDGEAEALSGCPSLGPSAHVRIPILYGL